MDHMDFRRVETLGVSDLEALRSVLQKDLDQMFEVISTYQERKSFLSRMNLVWELSREMP